MYLVIKQDPSCIHDVFLTLFRDWTVTGLALQFVSGFDSSRFLIDCRGVYVIDFISNSLKKTLRHLDINPKELSN